MMFVYNFTKSQFHWSIIYIMNSAVIVINLALIFYSIGVWSERIQGRLKVWHTVFFWLGLVCDTVGTGMMFEMAGGLTYDVHGLIGFACHHPDVCSRHLGNDCSGEER